MGPVVSCFIPILFYSWTVAAQDVLHKELLLSSPRTAFTSIEVDGKIYFPGGLNNREQATSTIDVFDIATQTWNNTLSLPSPRYYVTPAVVAPHLYFLGGSRTSFTTAAFQYDSSTKRMLATPELDMKQPIQASLSGSSLVMVGSNGIKFINLASIATGWTVNTNLDNIMESIAGAVVFSHDDTIFMFGGVNVSSRLPLSDAWIYDIETNNLTHFVDAISPIGHSNTSQYSLSVTNNVLVAVLANNSGCILFNVNTSTWLDITIPNIINVFSVPGFTFIFTSSGYYTVDWSSPRQDPVFSSVDRQIVHAVVYQEDFAYFVNYDAGYATMRCFSNGGWTSTNVSHALAYTSPMITIEWPSYGSVLATVDGIYLFNNCKVWFTAQNRIQGLVVSHPVPDQLYAIVKQSDNWNIYKYDAALALLETTITPFIPQLCFDNILFDFKTGRAFSLYTMSMVPVLSAANVTFDSKSVWIARGNYLFAINSGESITTTSLQMDIYNYETDTWLNSTTLPYSPANYYAQAFNMDGALTVFTSTHRLSFNISTYEWDELLLAPFNYSLPDASFSPMVLEVDDIVYTTTNVVRLRIVQNGAVDFSLISDQNRPKQMIYNQAINQILILTAANSIYTWNIANQQQELFLFPRPVDTGVIMATGGTIVLASSLNKEQFDYCDLTIQSWDFVPGLDSYVHPSVMTPVTIADKEYLLIAGGTDKAYKFNSNSIRLIDVSVLETLVKRPDAGPSVSISPSTSPLSQQDVTLIVAIVVPVGTVLVAGALLAFFLVRRQKKKKNGNHRMSTMGLEQQYGQWFIPFTSLTFHEQLGQGASGQVFKGTWNNTTVALKLSMTQANSSVIDELTLMMQLRPHPNVVQLLGFSVHPETDSIVLVIEYCNQGALDDILFNDKAPVSLKQKLEWLIGIAKGLSHLHSNNVVHRDVAARNVLMHQNEAKLTDFGMSRIVDSQQQRGTTKSELGPIRWMSPESLKNKEYSTKSDVWSFGVVAYEIVAQQEPHADQDPIQVGQMIRDSGLTPQLPDTCPSELASLIKSCWQLEPTKRPTIDEITSQLEDIEHV